jgi:hypothetical protein
MKKFSILLMVVLMLAGLTFTSFADDQDRLRSPDIDCAQAGSNNRNTWDLED